MDIASLKDWLGLISLLITIGSWAYFALTSGAKDAAKRVGAAEKALIDHDRRVQRLEDEMKHLPDRDTAHRLELTMERISGRLDALDERIRPIAQTSARLQEFLLEQAK